MQGRHWWIWIWVLVGVVGCLHLESHKQDMANQDLRRIHEELSDMVIEMKKIIDSDKQKLQQEKEIDVKIQMMERVLRQRRSQIINAISSANHYTQKITVYCDSNTAYSANQLYSQWSTLDRALHNTSTQTQSALVPQQQQLRSIMVHPITTPPLADSSNTLLNLNSGKWVIGSAKIEQVYNQNNQGPTLYCPLTAPNIQPSDKQCQSCPTDRPYYFIDNHTCIACNAYQPINRSCFNSHGALIMGRPHRTNYPAGKSRILLPPSVSLETISSQYISQNPQCPFDRPFYDGEGCLSCKQGFYFSYQHKICQNCPQNQYYDSITNHCLPVKYFSNLKQRKWSTFSQTIDDILESNTIARSDSSYQECPFSFPFATENKCISCPQKQHFSYDSLQCVQCEEKEVLDTNVHQCRQQGNLNYQTNPLTAPNLIYSGISPNQWTSIYYQNIEQHSGISDCPEGAPYFDGIVCINCQPSHPYFNLKSQLCQECSGVTLYDSQLKECLSEKNRQAVQSPSFQKMASVVFKEA